jgi:hypothetical protein
MRDSSRFGVDYLFPRGKVGARKRGAIMAYRPLRIVFGSCGGRDLSIGLVIGVAVVGIVMFVSAVSCTGCLFYASAMGSETPPSATSSIKEPRQPPAPPPPVAPPTEPATPVEGETAATDAQRLRAVAELRRDLGRLLARGRAMQRLRTRCDANDLDGCSECGDTMRRFQSEVRELRGRAEQLDEPLLVGAAASAVMCVSCSESAIQSCGWAGDELREWYRSAAPRRSSTPE